MLGVGLVLKADISPVVLFSMKLPILSIVCVAAGCMMYLTKTLDVDVYHRMLRGAVAFNEDLERHRLLKYIQLENGLSETITIYSRFKDAHRVTIEGKTHHVGVKEDSLRNRMTRFYYVATFGLFIVAIAVVVGQSAAPIDSSSITVQISGRSHVAR